MNNYKFLFTIVILFNYCLLNVLAENNYYVVSILRNKNDKNYDNESEQVQNAIDILVNDRMNDIYDMILENKDSYTYENGTVDEKLNELTKNFELKNQVENKKTKFLFINNNIFDNNRSFNETLLIQEGDGNENIEYIPIESELVSHICPVLNYYAIRVYLSDVTLEKIKDISNVIGYEISAKDSSPSEFSTREINYEMSKNGNITQPVQENSEKFYNKKEILEKTNWKGADVQEIQFLNRYNKITINYLSLISQGQYIPSEGNIYDNNYYYPSSAGKGVDIFVVDTGLHTFFFPKDFDTYEGTEDERVISCDGNFYDGKFHSVNATEKHDCAAKDMIKDYGYYYHGTVVAMAAAGTLNGSAKKANIHALAIVPDSESVLASMDYIKKNGSPHKTVINFSFGLLPRSQVIQDKLNEMTKDGFIFVIGVGNRGINVCTTTEDFATYEGFISVGAVDINNDDYVVDMDEPSYSIRISSYSDYGECLDIFAPGSIIFKNNDELIFKTGTSFSSPLVAGVAATLISEHPEIQYDYHSMKQTLIDLSVKDIIEGLEENTPNRLINNGKQFNYQQPRCDQSSGKYSCGNNSCCSVFGFCVDPETTDSSLKQLCYIDNGCQSEFGSCYDGNCNHENSINKCSDEECCSVKGECIKRDHDYSNQCFIENGCLSEFSGQCLSGDLKNIEKYNEKDQEIIIKYNCRQELEPYEICICSEWYEDDDCKMYHERNCEEFLSSPYKFAPTCEKLSDESKNSYPFNNINPNSIDSEVNIATCKIVCAKEDPMSSDKRCEISKANKYTDLSLVKKSCPFDECREGLKSYYNAQYNQSNVLYNEYPSDDYYYDKMMKYKSLLEFVSSEECLLSESSNLTTISPMEMTTSTVHDSDLSIEFINSDLEFIEVSTESISIEEEDDIIEFD